MRYLFAILTVVGVLAVVACGPGSEPEAGGVPSGGEVGAEGGTVTSEDGLFSVVIPAGALTEPTAISIEPVAPPDLGGADPFAGEIYLLEPAGLQFSSPVTLLRRLSAAELGIGDDEIPFISVFHGNEDGWQVLSSEITREDDEIVVQADASHFTWNYASSWDDIFNDRELTVRLRLSPSLVTAVTGQSVTVKATLESEVNRPGDVGGSNP